MLFLALFKKKFSKNDSTAATNESFDWSLYKTKIENEDFTSIPSTESVSSNQSQNLEEEKIEMPEPTLDIKIEEPSPKVAKFSEAPTSAKRASTMNED